MASTFQANILDIAPHSNLPNELLTEIFRLLIPAIVKIPGSISTVGPAWVLPCVSKKWRSIVLGTPEFWTSVYIDYQMGWSHRNKTIDIQKVIEISNRVLTRSGGALISLKIRAPAEDTRNWEPMTNLILSHAHRTQHLDLKIQGEILWDFLSLPPVNFPFLQFLSISSLDEADLIQSIVFQNSPNLKLVELDIEIDWSSTTLYLPWSNLEHLSITQGIDLSPLVVHTIMRECPSLITLQIILSEDNQTTDVIVPITCLALNTLLVQLTFCTTMADFLRPLTLPCLTKLELTSDPEIFDDGDDWDYSATLIIIPGFLQLTHLKIGIPIHRTYDMTPFLSSIPNILVLELPLLSHSALQLLSSEQRLPCLQIFRAYIETHSLSRYLTMLNHWADAGRSTRSEIFWATSRSRETYGADKTIVDKLVGRGLLEFSKDYTWYTQMRDLVPRSMRP